MVRPMTCYSPDELKVFPNNFEISWETAWHWIPGCSSCQTWWLPRNLSKSCHPNQQNFREKTFSLGCFPGSLKKRQGQNMLEATFASHLTPEYLTNSQDCTSLCEVKPVVKGKDDNWPFFRGKTSCLPSYYSTTEFRFWELTASSADKFQPAPNEPWTHKTKEPAGISRAILPSSSQMFLQSMFRLSLPLISVLDHEFRKKIATEQNMWNIITYICQCFSSKILIV